LTKTYFFKKKKKKVKLLITLEVIFFNPISIQQDVD